MPIGSQRKVHNHAVLVSVIGLLVGSAAPAHADAVRSMQWHLDAMKAEEMWVMSTGAGVTVAVIDTGVNESVPDLQGRVLKGKDLALRAPGDEHTDPDGHGTGMAALIAGTGKGNKGGGAFGLAPGAEILPIRMTPGSELNNQAEGLQDFNRTVPEGIRYAVDSGAKVINLSQGAEKGSRNLDEAVKYALGKGALIFAAVGNDAEKGNKAMYPASTPGVVGVGAIGRNLKKVDFSHYGSQVDLSAPGEEMVHACSSETGFCESYGTSTATAIVSASAALIWSKYPNWTNNQVLRAMLNTAGGPTSGAKRNDYVGYGAVRPGAALTKPGDPGPADEYPLPDLAEAEAAAKKKPSAEPSKPVDGPARSLDPAAAASGDDGGGDTGLWVGLSAGAVALAGVVCALLVVRRRRAAAAAPTVPQAYPPPHSQPLPSPYGSPPNSPYPNTSYGPPPGQGSGPAA
ncbi:type VII secretion-associated serine protease mycosin [Streptomyces durocortorensis]|uniref:Type VII secretion-associated serine protease mycosin n=1 Tax=Streptomyces durocortorensis TaxID=2811104 RepID=A0ABS2I440_9ACTN|nr:type VII secretion-associated serine protease mycosin [Streptomyces durocortorensis]MBM7057403.1 type VII secretion-associated serine protease mycosin [Streptomyces durocortorensis]